MTKLCSSWLTRVSYEHNHTQQSTPIPPGMALTNANWQSLRLVPWTSHSALVLSTLVSLVALEGECYSSTTTSSSSLTHLIRVVLRHQLPLWVVPLYWSGHWSCGLPTEHSLISHSDGQRYVRLWVRQTSAAILEVSSRHCSERMCQEEQLYDRGVTCNK